LVAADFTGNGQLDLCSSSAANGSSTIDLLLGNGDGRFGSPLKYVAGTLPLSLAAGGFRGNGLVDLAVGSAGNGINVLLGVSGVPPVSTAATAGTPQATMVTTNFPVNLQVKVTDGDGNGLVGVVVTFTAPKQSPSGTFAGATNVATAVTDANGVATAPTLKADRAVGVFTVAATVPRAGQPAKFHLTNRL
jgi:hypothetical protein